MDCDGDVGVSRKWGVEGVAVCLAQKRQLNTAAAGGRKRSKHSKRVCFVDVLPEDLVDVIVKESVRGHLDMGMLKAVCTAFNKALSCDQVWRVLVDWQWGGLPSIIAAPIERETSEQSWER